MQNFLYTSSVDARMDELRDFIVSRRNQLGISQVELAKRAGLSSGTIASIEAGRVTRHPRFDTLQAIAKGLGVSADRLERIVKGLPAGEDPGAQVEAVSKPEERVSESRRFIEQLVRRATFNKRRISELQQEAGLLGNSPNSEERYERIKEIEALIRLRTNELNEDVETLKMIRKMMDDVIKDRDGD